jgi:preprotein translocase subunit SecE
VKEYAYLIWLGLIAALFAVLWKTGQLLRLRTYVGETREELKKCTWPSRDELKGSTVVVVISTLLLGAFTVVLDFVIAWFVQQLI